MRSIITPKIRKGMNRAIKRNGAHHLTCQPTYSRKATLQIPPAPIEMLNITLPGPDGGSDPEEAYLDW
jgi:hypothetical protein